MESFFLAETTKYLYLLFDHDNFINNDGGVGSIIQTSNGECVIDAGGYIFNTEAHPIDPAALRCCYEMPHKELIAENFTPSKYLGETVQIQLPDENENETKAEVDLVEMLDIRNDSTQSTPSATEFSFSNDWVDAEEVQNELQKFLNELKKKTKKQETELEALLIKTNVTKQLSKSSVNNTDKPSMYENITIAAKIEKPLKNVAEPINKTNEINNASNSVDKTRFDGKVQQENISIEEKFLPEIESEPEAKPFDAQRLIERVRRMYNDTNVIRNYELLSCKSQSFLQRLAVLGEILT